MTLPTASHPLTVGLLGNHSVELGLQRSPCGRHGGLAVKERDGALKILEVRVQREHLVEMAQRPNITIQIIPNGNGPTSAYGRAFTILVAHNNSSVVYLEDPNSAHYVRDRDDVSRYTLIFDHLRASALDDTQTLRLLKGEEI